MDIYQILLALFAGIALSAACGCRVFVPMLVAAVAVRSGYVELSPDYQWVASDVALICLSIATVCEIIAYYIPVVDNFLDGIMIWLAPVAGTVVTASFLTEMAPWLQWTLALVAGGGVAEVVQLGTTAVRAATTTLTAGLGNSVVSTTETVTATALSILATLAPVLGVILVLLLAFLGFKLFRKLQAKRRLNKLAS